jgi:hypothetical protein
LNKAQYQARVGSAIERAGAFCKHRDWVGEYARAGKLRNFCPCISDNRPALWSEIEALEYVEEGQRLKQWNARAASGAYRGAKNIYRQLARAYAEAHKIRGSTNWATLREKAPDLDNRKYALEAVLNIMQRRAAPGGWDSAAEKRIYVAALAAYPEWFKPFAERNWKAIERFNSEYYGGVPKPSQWDTKHWKRLIVTAADLRAWTVCSRCKWFPWCNQA